MGAARSTGQRRRMRRVLNKKKKKEETGPRGKNEMQRRWTRGVAGAEARTEGLRGRKRGRRGKRWTMLFFFVLDFVLFMSTRCMPVRCYGLIT
jgi:hypothetical protein